MWSITAVTVRVKTNVDVQRKGKKPKRPLSSLWVSRTGSASDWCALQETLHECIDRPTIQYNTLIIMGTPLTSYSLYRSS